MTKSILIVDTPDSCINCNMYGFQHCYPIQKQIPRECLREGKPEWCPLRPLPSKRKIPITKTFGTPFNKGKAKGWNDCIDSITGETE